MRLFKYLLIIFVSLTFLPLFAQKKDQRLQNIEISAHDLRLSMDDFFVRFAGRVELAADRIIQSSPEKKVRKQALLWKLYAIPAAQRATMQRDPFGSLIDGAVLCMQMHDFFSNGNGKTAFGDHQSVAIQTSAFLMNEIRKIAKSLSKNRNTDRGETLLRSYANTHPVQSIYFVRENAHYLFEDYIKVEKMGFKKIARELTADMEDLMNRMNVYTENIPKQIRWQSELMMLEVAQEMDRENTFDFLSNKIIQKTDSLMAIYFRDINEMVEQSFVNVDSQRIMIMHALEKEREIAFANIRRERLETIESIKQERNIILDFIERERNLVFDQIDSLSSDKITMTLNGANQLTSSGIEDSLKGADQILDRVFNKLYLLLGILFFGGIAFVFFARIIWRR